MAKKAVGYIVVGERGVLELTREAKPSMNWLLYGDTATMFRSYSAARYAVGKHVRMRSSYQWPNKAYKESAADIRFRLRIKTVVTA